MKSDEVKGQVYSKKIIERDNIINPTDNSIKRIIKASVILDDDSKKKDALLSFSFADGVKTAVVKKDNINDFNLTEERLSLEIDTYFADGRKRLNELKERQDEVIKNVASIVDCEQMADQEVVLADLLERLNVLRREFLVLRDSLNFDQIYKLGNTYFNELVNKYASILNNDDIIRKQMDNIRSSHMYLDIVKSIKEMEEDNLNISLFCKEKIAEYESLDNNLSKTDEQIKEIGEVSLEISNLILEEEEIIRDLDFKIKNSMSTYEEVTYVVDSNNYALSNLLLAVATSKFIDNKGLKTAFLTLETFRFMRQVMSPRIKEEKTLKLEVIDYSSEIERAITDVEVVKKMLSDLKGQVKDIFLYFDKNFKEYIGVIPEYKEVLMKLRQVSLIIDEKEEMLNVNNDSLERQYALNLEKVKLKQDK